MTWVNFSCLNSALARLGPHTGLVLTWYSDVIIDAGRQPLFLALVAFLLTFVVTRVITRLIRAGKGPFKNVSAGGVHVHHVVPGIICVLIGGLLEIAGSSRGPWVDIGAVLFGVGAALVLDEFAMILHLDDVYWKEEGRKSADAVLIALAVMGGALLLANPVDPPGPDETDPIVGPLLPVLFAVFWLLPLLVTILKGKLWMAALSLAVPFMSYVVAWRLAKPNSPYARVMYAKRPEKLARAAARAQRSELRWKPLRDRLQALLFGFTDPPPNSP